jgi:hypothetical protein
MRRIATATLITISASPAAAYLTTLAFFPLTMNQPDGESILLKIVTAASFVALTACLLLAAVNAPRRSPLDLRRAILDMFFWMGIAIAVNVALFILIIAVAFVRYLIVERA